MIDIFSKTLEGLSFIDLFAGLGGFKLALESLGAHCVYSNDWDTLVQSVYIDNFGKINAEDITEVDEKTIPDHDILCAGFPCQAFSISGKKMGFDDSRGTLFFDVARIVKHCKPKVVFMENVRNLVIHDHGQTLQVIKNTLIELGYTFYYDILNAADYGVPQKRERVYMVAFRNDLNIQTFKFPDPVGLKVHVEDLLIEDENEVESLYVDRPDTRLSLEKTHEYSSKPIRIGMVNKGGQGERIYSVKGTSITLSAYGGGVFSKTGGYLINGKVRKLHPRECARLMGFPDSYKITSSPNQAYQQFGNSVVVDVLQYIGQSIGEALMESSKSSEEA